MPQEHYAEKQDIEAKLGYDIDDSKKTRPSATHLERLLLLADKQINGEMGPSVTSNIIDNTGYLRVIETELVKKMVNNMFAFSNPNDYTFIPEEFTDEEKILIHKATKAWAGTTFDLGD